MTDHLMHNVVRLPVNFVKGEGAYLYDDQGKRYLDALCGIAVTALGHAHPVITETICDQAKKLIHASNLYCVENQQKLADKLCSISGMENAFFCNSGAEANEAAIKIARLHGHNKGIDVPHVIVMEHNFHGRTMATLTASASAKVQAGFEPLVSGFVRVPYDNIDAVKSLAATRKDIVAILVEPVIGEGGIKVPAPGFLKSLREICDQQQWLLMLDEIQCGTGRTGKWFAFQHENILPDVLTVAKALGNGMPIGVCLARGVAAEVFKPGNHGTTFGGNPLSSATGLAVLNTIEKDKLLGRVSELGERILGGLKGKLNGNAGITHIRGKGLMIGIQLEKDCADIVKRALDKGLLLNVTAGNVVRLLPPYILSNEQADHIIDTVSELVTQFLAEQQ